jgi:hypothetical protein
MVKQRKNKVFTGMMGYFLDDDLQNRLYHKTDQQKINKAI